MWEALSYPKVRWTVGIAAAVIAGISVLRWAEEKYATLPSIKIVVTEILSRTQ